jgi:hypothetical protein
MRFVDRARLNSFLNDARRHRAGLQYELARVCMDSENSENDERAIRGAIVELDDLICSTTRRASSQNTSRGRIALAKAFRMNR